MNFYFFDFLESFKNVSDYMQALFSDTFSQIKLK